MLMCFAEPQFVQSGTDWDMRYPLLYCMLKNVRGIYDENTTMFLRSITISVLVHNNLLCHIQTEQRFAWIIKTIKRLNKTCICTIKLSHCSEKSFKLSCINKYQRLVVKHTHAGNDTQRYAQYVHSTEVNTFK